MSPKIRLGIVAENHYPRLGGMEYFNHMLARALARLPGVSVALACSTMRDVPRGFSYPYPVYRGASFSVLTRYLGRRNIERMIRGQRINVLYGASLHGSGFTAVEVGERLGLPVVVQSHGSDVQVIEEIGYGARLEPGGEARVRFVLEHADRVLAVSRMNRDMILDLGGAPERTQVVSGGTPHAEIGNISEVDVRGTYGLDPGDFVIITVGRNRPVKRMGLLFEALAILKGRGITMKCLCVGPAEDLPDMINEHGLEDVVVLTGRVPGRDAVYGGSPPPFSELINLYRAADLYVSVSYVESFGLTALDALACGVPVLVTGRHGVTDVLVEGETGFVLSDETAPALAERLGVLIDDRVGLRSRKKRIRSSVSHLTWDNAAKQLKDVCLPLV